MTYEELKQIKAKAKHDRKNTKSLPCTFRPVQSDFGYDSYFPEALAFLAGIAGKSRSKGTR